MTDLTLDSDAPASDRAEWSDVIQLHNLPSMPAVAVRLVQSFNDPDAPISEIVELLQADPALAVKLVHAANGPRYRTARPVTDLHRAAMLLGRKVVTSLALTFALSESSLKEGPDQDYFRDYWLQSVVQSTAMSLLAERHAPSRLGDYQITGLLMDIGRLALLSATEGAYVKVIDEADEMNRPLYVLEEQLLHLSHAELSARFLEEWGMPGDIVTAVRAHHSLQPPSTFPDEEIDKQLVAATQIGAAIGDYICSSGRGLAWFRLNDLMGLHYGADLAEVEALVHETRRRVDESSSLFNTDTRTLCSPLELMSTALKQLSQLALADVECAGERTDFDDVTLNMDPQRIAELTQASCLDSQIQVYQKSFLEERFRSVVSENDPSPVGLGLLLVAAPPRADVPQPPEEARDSVMQQAADVLSTALRPTDIIAREDECTLAALVTGVSCDDIERLSERLDERFRTARIRWPETALDARIAIGTAAALIDEKPTPDIEDLRRRCRAAFDSYVDTVVMSGDAG